MVVHPLPNRFQVAVGASMAGIDPRHRPHYLSLLPSGPDEVRNRLLRGDRPVRPGRPGVGPRGGIQPRI